MDSGLLIPAVTTAPEPGGGAAWYLGVELKASAVRTALVSVGQLRYAQLRAAGSGPRTPPKIRHSDLNGAVDPNLVTHSTNYMSENGMVRPE